MDLEPSRPVRWTAEGDGLLCLGRLPVRAPLVRRRALRSIRPRRGCRAGRYRTVSDSDLLAERVQPGSWTISPHGLRGCADRQRAAVPVPVLDWGARRASVLVESRKSKVVMRKLIGALVLFAAAGLTTGVRAQGKVNVVATTEDLASIGREIGGDRISIEAIARGYQDPHFVEAKPSFILKLQRPDLLVVVGRQLGIGSLPPLMPQG